MAILGYTSVVATGGAYLAFVLGLHRSRPASSGLTATLIEPDVAALLAALVLHERLLLSERAGCLLMLVAMVVLFRTEQRQAALGSSEMIRRERIEPDRNLRPQTGATAENERGVHHLIDA